MRVGVRTRNTDRRQEAGGAMQQKRQARQRPGTAAHATLDCSCISLQPPLSLAHSPSRKKASTSGCLHTCAPVNNEAQSALRQAMAAPYIQSTQTRGQVSERVLIQSKGTGASHGQHLRRTHRGPQGDMAERGQCGGRSAWEGQLQGAGYHTLCTAHASPQEWEVAGQGCQARHSCSQCTAPVDRAGGPVLAQCAPPHYSSPLTAPLADSSPG